MAPSILRKKSRSENVQAGVQNSNTVAESSAQWQNAAVRFQAAPPGQPTQPMKPDYRPAILSIMDQEWVHQVGPRIIRRANSLEDTPDLRPRI